MGVQGFLRVRNKPVFAQPQPVHLNPESAVIFFCYFMHSFILQIVVDFVEIDLCMDVYTFMRAMYITYAFT